MYETLPIKLSSDVDFLMWHFFNNNYCTDKEMKLNIIRNATNKVIKTKKNEIRSLNSFITMHTNT